jgi:allantoin racemase
MRLLYIFPRTTPDPVERQAEHARRRGILQAAASPGTTVDLRELDGCPPAIESIRDGYAVAMSVIRMAEEVEDQYDAMIVGCFGDPAVDGAIEGTTRIPIVGTALPSMAAALMLGDRFGILSPSENSAVHNRRAVMEHGLLDRYAGAVGLGIGVREFQIDPERTLRVAEDAGRTLIAMGAEVILLGCLSLAFTGVDEDLQRRLGIPVVNPLRVAVRTCEMLVGSGLSPSRRYASRSASETLPATKS